MIGIYYERDVNFMNKIKAFLKKKDVVITLQRYGIDALGAMAQGLFCTLLVGTIFNLVMGVVASKLMLKSISKFKVFRKPWFYGGKKNA